MLYVPLTPEECRAPGSAGRLETDVASRVASATRLKPQRLAVGGHAAPVTGVLATHVRAPAQELLDLALVGVLLLGAAHHLRQAHVL